MHRSVVVLPEPAIEVHHQMVTDCCVVGTIAQIAQFVRIRVQIKQHRTKPFGVDQFVSAIADHRKTAIANGLVQFQAGRFEAVVVLAENVLP